jgi:hypothetical protein
VKVTHCQQPRKEKFNQQSQSFTLSCAKTYLGRLVRKAMNGEPVYIVRGPHRFTLQHVPEIDPIPMRPPGYFAHGDTGEEIALENRLSKASVVRTPKDLE